MKEIDKSSLQGHQTLSDTLKDEGNALFKAHKFVMALSKYDEGLEFDAKNTAIRSNRCTLVFDLVLVIASTLV
jgi:hypothetical protein